MFLYRFFYKGNMHELKEAFIYATVNGITGFTLYTGAAMYYGENLAPAAAAGLAIGMLAFGSYLLREVDEVTAEIPKKVPKKKHVNEFRRVTNLIASITPSCVKRYGLFRFI